MGINVSRNQQDGFSLIELLVALAIIGILSAVAIPAYNNYIVSSRKSTAQSNLQTLKLAEEAYFFDHNTYLGGTYDPAHGTDSLTGSLGWKPNQDGNKYLYSVIAGPCGNISSCYTMTVSYNGTVMDTQSH